MNTLSVTQSYMLCALNENGKFPVSKNEIPACIVASSLIELLLENCVSITGKKVHTAAPLKENLSFLQSIYEFIKEKAPVKLEKLAGDYCFTFSGKRINELTHAVGNELAGQNCVVSKQGGLMGNKDIFIPNPDAVDRVVQHIRAELLEDGNLSDEIIALTCLLEKSGLLKRYFSSYEKETLKGRLKEIRKEPSNQIIKEMLDYLDAILVTVIIAAT